MPDRRDLEDAAQGGGLGADALRDAASVARKRWQKPTYMAQALRAVADQYDLPGIAVVRAARVDAERILHPAFPVPFEPIELDETHPTLRALCGETAVGANLLTESPARSTGRRLAIRFGVPLVVGLITGIGAVLAQGDQVASKLGLAIAGGLIGVAFVIVFRWRSGRWFIVPGGVVVRKGVGGLFVGSAERYSLEDSVLLIDHGATGWEASVCRGRRWVSREVTPLEVAALLGAWQSTVSAGPMGEYFPP